jgi:CHAT domain-containing protein
MEWRWRFTILKGEILLHQGFPEESVKLLKPDIPLSLDGSEIAVWRKMTLGAANSFLKRFSEARLLLGEAQALAKANHPELLGEIQLRTGTLAYFEGNAAAAESAYRDTLQTARNQKDSYLEVAALGSLGFIAAQQEHYDESIDWNRAALRLSQSIGAQDSIARIFGNMGWSYFEIGDYENALALFQQAADSSGKVGLVVDQVYWKINTGAVEYYLHDYSHAQEQSLEALELARKLNEKAAITESLNNLSYIALAQSHLNLAETRNQEALQISHAASDHSGELSSMLIEGRIERGKKHYPQAEQLFEAVIRDPAADTTSRWEAEARLANVYEDAGLPQKAQMEFRKSIETIEAARASVQSEELRVPFLSSAIEFYDDYIDFLVSHGKNIEALKIVELNRARTLREGLKINPASMAVSRKSIEPLQAARKTNSILLSYWLGRERSYLWAVVPAGRIELFTLPPQHEIASDVKAYREALAGPRDVLETSNASGRKLYEVLVAPARKLIAKDSRVVILPDGALNGLNFETLLVPAPRLHYWIEDVTLSNASSITFLSTDANAKSTLSPRLLLIGDPVSPNREFPALQEAAQEMENVKTYFPSQTRTVASKGDATASAYLKGDPGNYSFIHFVAHGTANRVSPLDSAIILSKEGDSFKLYARDIIAHPLHADLVTISACNSEGARAYSGEGLVGLSWAFLRAGAHNVIGALWEVSDTSTPQLMGALYGELRRGKEPAEALRIAKLSLLHSDTVYKKPFYWAPFQIYKGM